MNLYDMEEYNKEAERHREKMNSNKSYKKEYLNKNNQVECLKCNTIQSKYNKYCSNCGQKMKK